MAPTAYAFHTALADVRCSRQTSARPPLHVSARFRRVRIDSQLPCSRQCGSWTATSGIASDEPRWRRALSVHFRLYQHTIQPHTAFSDFPDTTTLNHWVADALRDKSESPATPRRLLGKSVSRRPRPIRCTTLPTSEVKKASPRSHEKTRPASQSLGRSSAQRQA